MDTGLFQIINGFPHPVWANALALVFDKLGHFQIGLLVFSISFVLGCFLNKKELWQPALKIVIILAVTLAAVGVLKSVFHRPRPFILMHPSFLMGTPSGASFPSGHAAVYAALAAFACFYYGRAKYFWISMAFAGGVFRVYQGVHYPSDVVAGWMIGFGIAHFFAKSILTSPVLGYNKKKE